MRTWIIAVACAKGGCSKTTTAMNLAGILSRWGKKTVVLDTDNTGGAIKWDEYVRAAGERLPFDVVPMSRAGLIRNRILEQYEGYWVFVDTPPELQTCQAAIDICDVTIIPTQPSVVDLRLAGETYAAAPNALVLLTKVKARTKLARDAITELDGAQIARFDTVISEREEIKSMYGTTLFDMKEYSSVAHELVTYLDGIEQQEQERSL